MQEFLERFPVVTVVVLLLVITGCVDVIIDGSLSQGYKDLLGSIDVPVGLLALGRGLQKSGIGRR